MRAVVCGFAVMMTLLAFNLSVIALMAQRNQTRHHELVEQLTQAGATLATNTRQLHVKLDRIEQSFDTTFEFVHEPYALSTGAGYRRNREIIETARRRVWVLHHARNLDPAERDRIRGGTENAHRNEQERYDGSLLLQVERNHQSDFEYIRIIQCPDDENGPLQESVIGDRWMTHCRGMLSLQRNRRLRESVQLRKAPYLTEHTFIIVDRSHVILVLDAIDSADRYHYEQALLIIVNPRDELLKVFEQTFEAARAHSFPIEKEEQLA